MLELIFFFLFFIVVVPLMLKDLYNIRKTDLEMLNLLRETNHLLAEVASKLGSTP